MRELMRNYLKRVADHDLEGVLSLFSESISVEDPVGGPPGTHVVGIADVSEFFRRGFGSSAPHPTPIGPIVTTAGNEAAMMFTLRLLIRGEERVIDVIDVFRFDGEDRIESLRAFWNFEEARHP
jgi:hypothetical protein